MTVGENIRRLRKEKGLTQKQLGNLCGINEANIRKYELGGANPKIETIQKIAKGLEVHISQLLNTDFSYTEILLPDNPIVKAILQSNEKISDFEKEIIYDLVLEEIGMSEDKLGLLINYNLLNDLGQAEARKRVEELTEVPKYQKEETE